MVLDEARGRLYVMARFANAVAVLDLATGARREPAAPAPGAAPVVAGRRFLYDATLTSSIGEASCSSCHVFADMDDLAWDLGNPDGDEEPNPNPFFRGAHAPFHPMKGPMATQSPARTFAPRADALARRSHGGERDAARRPA